MLSFVSLNYNCMLGLWVPSFFSQIAYGFLQACDATSTSELCFHAFLFERLADLGPKLSSSCSAP